jgi:hypothetical protein
MLLAMFGETLIADLYRLRTIRSEGVPPGRSVSVSSHGLSYLLASRGIWSLRERVICHQQKSAS